MQNDAVARCLAVPACFVSHDRASPSAVYGVPSRWRPWRRKLGGIMQCTEGAPAAGPLYDPHPYRLPPYEVLHRVAAPQHPLGPA
ncbi:hypothetical protein MRX96_019605 [Rhipicephalus microplus]